MNLTSMEDEKKTREITHAPFGNLSSSVTHHGFKESINIQGVVQSILHSNETLINPIPFKAIGDLDGSFNKYLKLTQEFGVMSQRGNWCAGNETVIFLGDILADRTPEGFKILDDIDRLRTQAESKGGNIVVIAGNHEEFMLGYLTELFVNLRDNFHTQYFHSKRICSLHELEHFGNIYYPKILLKNMQKDVLGRKYLKYLIEFKLCYRIGDVLFFHTPPTESMLDILQAGKNLDTNISMINTLWRNTLIDLLFAPNPSEIAKDEYRELASVFLKTQNDTLEGLLGRMKTEIPPHEIERIKETYRDSIATTNPLYYEFFHKEGIRKIVYGHASRQMSEVPGFSFYAINRTGIYSNKNSLGKIIST